MNVEQTLAELVAIDSTSSRSNAEIISLLAARVEALGMCARTFPYGVRLRRTLARLPNVRLTSPFAC